VQQPVGRLPVEGRILYIFPDNSGSLLLTATEEASAVMMVLYRLGFMIVILLV
jgi:hypothetical protein